MLLFLCATNAHFIRYTNFITRLFLNRTNLSYLFKQDALRDYFRNKSFTFLMLHRVVSIHNFYLNLFNPHSMTFLTITDTVREGEGNQTRKSSVFNLQTYNGCLHFKMYIEIFFGTTPNRAHFSCSRLVF